jgi:hypothetical protein
MARQNQSTEAAPQQGSPPANGSPSKKPIHEIRIGKIKSVIWCNDTQYGTRHNVTLRRIYKRDGDAQWSETDSLGRDDLPIAMEVLRQAWLWVHAHGQG